MHRPHSKETTNGGYGYSPNLAAIFAVGTASSGHGAIGYANSLGPSWRRNASIRRQWSSVVARICWWLRSVYN